MNIRLGNGLWLVLLWTAILVISVLLYPIKLLIIPLSVPFLLLFPGYSLLSAVFPARDRFTLEERIGLSLVTSVALVAINGVVLNKAGIPINALSFLYPLSGMIAVFSVVGLVRARALSTGDRFNISVLIESPAKNWFDKALFVLLGISILSAFVALAYLAFISPASESFSEFYFINPGAEGPVGKKQVLQGESQIASVGVYNQYQKTLIFSIDVNINGEKNNSIPAIELANRQEITLPVSYTPTEPGLNQKVEFVLYDAETLQIYQQIFLLIDVIKKE